MADPYPPPDIEPLRARIAAAEAELHQRDAEHIRLCRAQMDNGATLSPENARKLLDIAERYANAVYAEERERQDDA